MLCTNCRRPIKPVVSIDIDGTLGDYHTHLVNFAIDWFGPQAAGVHRIPAYDGSTPHKLWFTEAFECDVTTFRQVKLAFRQGGSKRTMPVFAGARDLLETCRAYGAEVWLTTTRPFARFDRIDPDTQEWLRRYQLPFDYIIYDDHKVDELFGQAGDRVCFFLDDQIENLEQAADVWPGSDVLIRTIYTRGVIWKTMAENLGVAAKMAVAHIQRHSLEGIKP